MVKTDIVKPVKPSGVSLWSLWPLEKCHVIVLGGFKELIMIIQSIWLCTPKCNSQIKFVGINMTRESENIVAIQSTLPR